MDASLLACCQLHQSALFLFPNGFIGLRPGEQVAMPVRHVLGGSAARESTEPGNDVKVSVIKPHLNRRK